MLGWPRLSRGGYPLLLRGRCPAGSGGERQQPGRQGPAGRAGAGPRQRRQGAGGYRGNYQVATGNNYLYSLTVTVVDTPDSNGRKLSLNFDKIRGI